MSSPSIITRCDPDTVALLCKQISRITSGHRCIDAIVAARSVIVCALGYSSADLEAALDNVDRLAADMKDALRKRMGN